MATSEIENYIYLLSQGLDSGGVGRFTLNKLPRSKGLLEAAELYPYRWVYFAIQAAVCARATAVKVGSNATSVSVEFELNEVAPEFLVPDLVLGESSASERAVRFWAQSVLWASALNPLSVHLLCEGTHTGYRATVMGENSSKCPLPPKDQRSRLAIVVNFGLVSPRRVQLSAYLEKQLAREMAFMNLPLRLEGREAPLGCPPHSGYGRVGLHLSRPDVADALGFIIPSLLNFGEYRLPNGAGHTFDVPPGAPRLDLSGAVDDRVAVRTELRTSWNSLSVRKTERYEWLLPLDFVPKIPATQRVWADGVAVYREGKPSRLFPVHHGLSLLPLELEELSPGWDVFWPMPDGTTDYLGLSAVQDECFTATREQAVSWAQTL
ncbi:hypothetical protein ABS71_02675 [bacterium SCN 62-11]|nr:hypothetical protein [Candidatus Eremiobacteraeota bacterium]ODT77287.1 MAG: hypothetical protein ABS71_02675 [bacterium SCN 62-11]